MLIVCWSAKGGSGTTVVATALALASGHPVTLIDLAGDVSPTLGVPEPPGPGVHDWLASVDTGPEALDRLAGTVGPGVRLLPAGRRRDPVPDAAWDRLAGAARTFADVTIVDAGTGSPPRPLTDAADRVLLVTRSCFLSLRRAASSPVRPSGIVLVTEPGRTLRSADVERAVSAPVVAEIAWDPAIARAVDAGLLAGRPPRSLLQSLRGLT